MEKPLETASIGLKFGWVRISGNHQDGANSMRQIDGVSDVVSACWFCGFLEGGLRKSTVTSVSTSVREKAAPHPLQLLYQGWTIQFLPICL